MYPEPAPYQCYALLQLDVSMRQDFSFENLIKLTWTDFLLTNWLTGIENSPVAKYL